MALLLLGESCTVTIAHSRTRDLPDVVRRADIIVAAVGRAEMSGPEMAESTRGVACEVRHGEER
jgi:methylenetetrahydrofolate dehydrogenase (NADP+)/methenyltetrahydrofolate cyclohydrolase